MYICINIICFKVKDSKFDYTKRFLSREPDESLIPSPSSLASFLQRVKAYAVLPLTGLT